MRVNVWPGPSRAKSGSVSVVNPQGRLAGIFTDGDLRRYLAEDPGVLAKPLVRVMTRHPITIRETALAADALKLFKEYIRTEYLKIAALGDLDADGVGKAVAR